MRRRCLTRPARAVRDRKSRALLAVGVLLLALGYSYTEPLGPSVRTVSFPVSLAPIGVYVGLFMLTGLMAIVGALWRRYEPIGFAATQLACAGWSVGAVGSWLVGDYDRGWVLAALLAALSVLINCVAGMRDRRTW